MDDKRKWLKGLFETHKGLFYSALVLGIGLALMLFPGKERETLPAEPQQSEFSLEEFTASAEELLSRIDGVGKLSLQFSLETDGSRSFLYDLRESRGEVTGDLQKEAVLINQDGNQEPVALERVYPSFRGAVVVCQGADSSRVTLAIKEALSSLTGLGMDKIKVLKMD